MRAQPGGWDAEVVARLLNALQASGHGSITFEGRGPGQKLRLRTELTAMDEQELAATVERMKA